MILEDYIQLNKGVADRETLIQLAPFALYRKIGKERVSSLFPIQPNTPYHHRPWFIWNTLRLAGLERHWYADELNRGQLKWKGWIRRIEADSTQGERDRWQRLLYRGTFPDPKSRERKEGNLWSKGGGWSPKLGMSRVLVLREHLVRDPPTWGTHQVMNEERIRRIEDEVMIRADPDRFLMPEAYWVAVLYVRDRWKDFTGRNLGWHFQPWFWQMDIQDEEGWWIQRDSKAHRGTRNRWKGLHPSIDW